MEYLLKKYQLFAILVGIMLLINVLMLPDRLSFTSYLCYDSGASIKASSMLQEGLVPWRDYNYNYGFATLWLNQLWFNGFGYTPLANESLNILCSILLCWGIAEMITVMQWSKTITWLVLLSTPYLFCYSWFTTVHIMEPALIVLSLVRYLRREYASALLFATLALLFKPSLAYFTGLYLVIAMLTNRDGATISQHGKRFVRYIAPSLGLLLAYTIYVLPKWGWQVYLNSLVPFSAMAGQQEASHGFFLRGKLFWLPTTEGLGHLLANYVSTPAGVWIVGSILMTCFTVTTMVQWLKTRSLSCRQRCILICGVLHLIFVLVLFGNECSWAYEHYLVIFGVAACLNLRFRLPRVAVLAFAGFMLISFVNTIRSSVNEWQTANMQSDMHYLFLPEWKHQELAQLRTLAQTHQVLILGKFGVPSLLLQGVKCVPTWYYMRTIAKDHEHLSMLNLIDQADIVVVPIYDFIVEMTIWPEIADHLKRFALHGNTDILIYFTNEKDSHLLPLDKKQVVGR